MFNAVMRGASRLHSNAIRFARNTRSWALTCGVGAGIVVSGDTIKAKGPAGMRGRWGYVAVAGCVVAVATRVARERRFL
jgi:hypothetical protein